MFFICFEEGPGHKECSSKVLSKVPVQKLEPGNRTRARTEPGSQKTQIEKRAGQAQSGI